jgi:DNA-binding transcriptional ArsR family regulator
MAEDIIILEPGDERAQKIGKAISSQTANDILQLLSEKPRTATDLTDTLHIPMSTIKYHLDNLIGAGLLEVTETRYSVKGREIKVYGVRNQLVIVAPKMANIRSILLKYASLFSLVIIASLVMFAILPLFQAQPAAAPSPIMKSDGAGETGMLSRPPEVPGIQGISQYAPVLAFFGGGCLIILLLFLYEIYKWQRVRSAGTGKQLFP